MKRIDVINQILRKKRKRSRYLEIGVRNGRCFFSINATVRLAVDPNFRIGKKTYLNAYLGNPMQWFRDAFFSQTSDDFFERNLELLLTGRPDVVLIDGLHTYEQSYKDVVNSIKVLDQDGVIVMHDCNPDSLPAAYPATSPVQVAAMNFPGWNKVWCGDVWKTIVRLQTVPDLEVFVLNTDFGLGIVRRNPGSKPPLRYTAEEIDSLTYGDLEMRRTELLNLKSPDYFPRFIQTVK